METRAATRKKQDSRFNPFKSFTFWGLLFIIVPICIVLFNHHQFKKEIQTTYGDEARTLFAKENNLDLDEVPTPGGIKMEKMSQEIVDWVNGDPAIGAFDDRPKEIYRVEFAINSDRANNSVVGMYVIYHTKREMYFDDEEMKNLME